MDWFQIGKGVRQGCILSPCLFNLGAEYNMRNAGVYEPQAGIKIVGRNISNHIYTDDTNIMPESQEKVNSLLIKFNEENEMLTYNSTFSKVRSWCLVPPLHGK